MDYSKTLKKVMEDYPQYIFAIGTPSTYCFVGTPVVCLEYGILENTFPEDVFDVLHEIGHLETNKKNMKRYEKEFYATVWAIQHAPDYQIKISKRRQRDFEDDVKKWRLISIKKGGKNVWSLSKCKFNWNMD